MYCDLNNNIYINTFFYLFIMNKFNHQKLTKPQLISQTCYLRISRFIDNYNYIDEIKYILNDFNKNNLKNLHTNGLRFYYNKLKQNVIENNNIGLIILGSNLKNILLSIYTTNHNQQIPLYVDKICNFLLIEYFNTNDEIDNLCLLTPNYEIYKDIKY